MHIQYTSRSYTEVDTPMSDLAKETKSKCRYVKKVIT